MRDSVSIILKVKDQILAIRRQENMRAFPGYTAFTGGTIDKEDLEKDNDGKGHYSALIRETMEELSVDLSKYKKEEFLYLGVAETPKFNPHRFANHYYLLELDTIPKIRASVEEIDSYKWLTPAEFVESFNRGELLMVPPTLNMFKILASNNLNPPYDLTPKEVDIPCIEVLRGVHQYMPLSHTFPPANRTNCFLIGDILVDPSPIDRNEFDKLYNLVKEENIVAVMISHHHPDHHEFAPDMARALGVKILIGQDSHQRILAKWGESYFDGCELRYINDGETITKWLGEAVKVQHVPGHDEGQMALVPLSKKWYFVGDLIQTVGTVVVGGPEGDMKKYFETLEKIIEMKPHVLFPSHGIAVSGVHRLVETLEHRKMRERSIIEYLKENLSEDEMIRRIYPDLNEKLLPYARLTLEAHLKKIKKD